VVLRAQGADTHHGVLVVSNHDTIAPRSGFETHPHRNMEIVTWVLDGSLVHQDTARWFIRTQRVTPASSIRTWRSA
jgi:redox-sensitive bicupin YhaK (pirin superfamily)